ncbi:MAG: SCP2 domain-containing protein [Gammaproteobacteria bacterium]
MFHLFDLALSPLNKLVNATLQLDPESAEKLIPLAGKVLAVEWTSLNMTLYLYVLTEGVRFSFKYSGTPDTTLTSSTPLAFIRLLMQPEVKGPSSDITIQGDPHFAQDIQSIFSNLDIDWEEQLSKFVGDGATFHVSKVTKHLQSWLSDSRQSLQSNTTEFLQQETAQLPPRAAVEDFLRAVDHLRNDVERASVRVKHIAKDFEALKRK